MIFQYQALAEPLIKAAVNPPEPPAPPVELMWQPRYPDYVSHRRSIYAPFVSVAPIIELPPGPLTWQPHYPDRVPHRRSIYAPSVNIAPFIVGGVLPLRVSQLPAEVVFQYGSVLTRASQLPVEIAFAYTQNIRWTRVTQIVVEIVYPFGCYIYVPPLPASCPVPNPDTESGVACTALVLGGGA